jgi:hypothetical protein
MIKVFYFHVKNEEEDIEPYQKYLPFFWAGGEAILLILICLNRISKITL